MGRFLFAALFPRMNCEQANWAVQSRFVWHTAQGWVDRDRWELV